VTVVTNETQAATFTTTLVVGGPEDDHRRIVSYGYYRPANPGDIIELSPPLEPGTIADVVAVRISEDDPSVFVIEIARIRTR
jgi:hypothetical protein